MIRKAALVGCKEGPWVAIHGLRSPQLRSQGAAFFHVEHEDGQSFDLPAGCISIGEGTFVRVSVIGNDFETALCDIIAKDRYVHA